MIVKVIYYGEMRESVVVGLFEVLFYIEIYGVIFNVVWLIDVIEFVVFDLENFLIWVLDGV